MSVLGIRCEYHCYAANCALQRYSLFIFSFNCNVLKMCIVVYRDGTSKLVRNPADFPDLEERSFKVSKLQEPMVLATLIFPDVSYLMME